jgi:hypothetical protein
VNVRRLGRKPFRWEFSLLLLADIALRLTNQNFPRSCIQYRYRYIYTHIKGAATNKTFSVFLTFLYLSPLILITGTNFLHSSILVFFSFSLPSACLQIPQKSQ